MKYCVQYYQDFRYFAIVDEIILKYKDHNDHMLNFIKEEYTTQRIIIDICSRENEIDMIIPIVKEIYENYPNIAVKLCFNEDAIIKLKENEIPFFLQEHCSTFEQMYAFVHMGVTDIYVVEELGFNLPMVKQFCGPRHITVRAFPNVAQSAPMTKQFIPDLLKFFIRPEDTKHYEHYIDVFEFFGPPEKMSVLFDIYNSRQWLGNLNELILGFEDDYDNSGLILFGDVRKKCTHRCMHDDCTLCFTAGELSNNILESGIEVMNKRETDWKKRNYDEQSKRIELGKTTDQDAKAEAADEPNKVSEE